jgi:hypothetical protein
VIYTPDNIEALGLNQVFVFGSNLAGRHGGGAALLAAHRFGAVYGVGVGHEGRSYALPTKGQNIETLPLSEIEKHIGNFVEYAAANPSLTFFVTQIGCGLAGYTPKEIAPLFFYFALPPNVILPEVFWAEGVGE